MGKLDESKSIEAIRTLTIEPDSKHIKDLLYGGWDLARAKCGAAQVMLGFTHDEDECAYWFDEIEFKMSGMEFMLHLKVAELTRQLEKERK